MRKISRASFNFSSDRGAFLSPGFCEEESFLPSPLKSWAVRPTKSTATSATMAFRTAHRDLLLPIPAQCFHDEWIALLIGAASHLVPLPEPLIGYRQHGHNQVGVRRGNKRGKSCAEIYGPQVTCFELAIERLLKFSGDIADIRPKILRLEEKLYFSRARAALPAARWRRVPGALRELSASRYHRYARGFSSFCKDVLR